MESSLSMVLSRVKLKTTTGFEFGSPILFPIRIIFTLSKRCKYLITATSDLSFKSALVDILIDWKN